jgi:hypothetical protein
MTDDNGAAGISSRKAEVASVNMYNAGFGFPGWMWFKAIPCFSAALFETPCGCAKVSSNALKVETDIHSTNGLKFHFFRTLCRTG